MLLQFFLLLITITFTEQEHIITTTKYSKVRVSLKIVNGVPVLKGQVPYLVSIKQPVHKLSNNRSVWSNICGGSIIAPAKVLTAAHCFEKRSRKKMRIVAGNLKNVHIHTGKTETTEKAQWRSIARVISHRDYYFPLHDIALVFVDTNFTYSDTVDYVIPARKLTDYPRTCKAAGFGQTGSRHSKPKAAEELMWVDIYMMSRRECNLWWELIMDTFICTNSRVSDVAGGDSGGPLSCYGTLDHAEEMGRDLLVGIVSGKNYDKTTLFTRVAAYADWLARDDCIAWAPSKLVVSIVSIITLVNIRLLILFIYDRIKSKAKKGVGT